VSNENRHTVGSASGDRESGNARDEHITFCIGDRSHIVGRADFSHEIAMDLTLFEQTIERNTQSLRETRTVLPNGIVHVAQVRTEVQGIVGRRAHPTLACGECMTEAVATEKR
jgi:hypothetical protein